MYFPPAPFSLADAVICSLLVDTAYDQFTQWVAQGNPPQNNFNWKPKAAEGFNYSAPLWWIYQIGATFIEPFGFVAQAPNGDSFLAFRGTETDADAGEDARTDQTPYTFVANFGNAHAGFFGIYNAMRPAILQAVNALNGVKRFFFTGHSLGSGLSTLAVPDMINNSNLKPSAGLPMYHYNLASPRVGDPTFAYMMNFSTGVPTYRVVNTEDVVPDLPPPEIGSLLFKHIGTPVDYTAQYGSVPANHDHWNSYNYALNHPDQPEGPLPPPTNRIIGPTSRNAEIGLLLKAGGALEQIGTRFGV
jgi:triacylglycerol lipase